MQLAEIKKLVQEIVDDEGLILYDINWIKEYGEDILQILVDKKGGIDLNALALVNEKISLMLDTIEIDLPNYMLEVSSPGAEKELRSKEEILDAVSSYIYLETIDQKIMGYLLEANDDSIVVKVNLKGRMKNFTIKYDDIKFIRLAVKM